MIDIRIPLCLTGCAVFGTLLIAELQPDAQVLHRITPAAVPAASIAAVPKSPPAASHELLNISLARPLFSPTRRPPAKDGDGSSAGLGDKRLTGIVIAPDRRLAIFAVNGARPIALREGESIDGWRVETIGRAEVAVFGPAGAQTLTPRADPNAVRDFRMPPVRRPIAGTPPNDPHLPAPPNGATVNRSPAAPRPLRPPPK